MGAVNLRDVPDELHRALKVEAALRGTSVKALVIQIAREWLEREGKGTERLRARPGAGARRKGGRA
jgi:plasmid stability protein